MPRKPVDTQIKVIVGPLWNDITFKTRETAIDYNAAGMDVDIIVEKADGTVEVTAITLSNSGDYLWTHETQGYYSIVLPASGGASFNNTEEGILRAVGYCTGVLPFGSIAYDIGRAKIDVADLLAATGITVGGTWTIAKAFKMLMAFIAGQGQDSAVAGWKDVLDPDDGETVVYKVTLKPTTPQRIVEVEI